LAVFFWEFQKRLSAVSHELKTRLESYSVMNIGEVPQQLPEIVEPLMRHTINEDTPNFTYPDLIYDDLERQNLLSIDHTITGLVDLDSIRTGDILYEFGHFLFNFVLCDPEADYSIIDLYIDELIKAGVIDPQDVPAVYGHIFRFAISDVMEFQQLSQNPIRQQYRMIDMKLLIQQYDQALTLASSFFRKRFSL